MSGRRRVGEQREEVVDFADDSRRVRPRSRPSQQPSLTSTRSMIPIRSRGADRPGGFSTTQARLPRRLSRDESYFRSAGAGRPGDSDFRDDVPRRPRRLRRRGGRSPTSQFDAEPRARRMPSSPSGSSLSHRDASSSPVHADPDPEEYESESVGDGIGRRLSPHRIRRRLRRGPRGSASGSGSSRDDVDRFDVEESLTGPEGLRSRGGGGGAGPNETEMEMYDEEGGDVDRRMGPSGAAPGPGMGMGVAYPESVDGSDDAEVGGGVGGMRGGVGVGAPAPAGEEKKVSFRPMIEDEQYGSFPLQFWSYCVFYILFFEALFVFVSVIVKASLLYVDTVRIVFDLLGCCLFAAVDWAQDFVGSWANLREDSLTIAVAALMTFLLIWPVQAYWIAGLNYVFVWEIVIHVLAILSVGGLILMRGIQLVFLIVRKASAT